MAAERELDLVLFGATGFVGRLTAEYLAAAAGDEVRVGLAGRSREKLERLRAQLGERASQWGLIVAECHHAAALKDMAGRARAIATTVGPYRKYGIALVEACASAGTHYADLTGEPLFMRETIDRCDAVAKESGARIVHTCGFDSVPSDIGVLLAHEAAGELEATTPVGRRMKGGVSGGTADSPRGQIDEGRADPSPLKVVGHPYAPLPDPSAEAQLR